MSREFGSYNGGFFHEQIEQAADDCLAGIDKTTQLWGAFLKEFYDVAYAISTSEAGDSGEYFPIMKTIEKMPILTKKLNDVFAHVEIYNQVAREAVRKAVEEKKL